MVRSSNPAREDRRATPDALRSPVDAPIHLRKVQRVRRQLKLGIYDEAAKLDAALDQLIEDLIKEPAAQTVTSAHQGENHQHPPSR